MANDAELLADLLDGRLDPAQVPAELAQLAQLADSVSQHITLVPPTADFRAALREELLETVGTAGSGPSDGGGGPGTGGAPGAAGSGGATSATSGAAGAASAASGIPAVIAAVAATAVLATSTYAATTQSVPGDPLYGLKQGIESLQLTIADDARDVELLVAFATERVREAVGVADPVVVGDLLVESERLLDDALALAVAQGRQVQDLLDGYAGALVTLDSRIDDPTVRAKLDQLMHDVGASPTPPPTTPAGPDLGRDPQDGSSGPSGDAPDQGPDEPGGQPQEHPDDASDDPLDGLDDPLDDLDDPLDDLDDPLDQLDDPLDELDDPLSELGDELDETLEETTGPLGG